MVQLSQLKDKRLLNESFVEKVRRRMHVVSRIYLLLIIYQMKHYRLQIFDELSTGQPRKSGSLFPFPSLTRGRLCSTSGMSILCKKMQLYQSPFDSLFLALFFSR